MAEPSMTTTTTKRTVFTRQMVDRMLGRPGCDVSDVPFCGWGDALPPSLFDQTWAPLTQEQFDAMEFDYIDERLSMVTFHGVSGMRALDVLDATKVWRTANIEWGKATRRGEVLGIAADQRDAAVDALCIAVDAWRKAVAADHPETSTEEDR